MPRQLPPEVRLSRTVVLLAYLAMVIGTGLAFVASPLPRSLWETGVAFTLWARSLW